MISYDEALARIERVGRIVRTEWVPLGSARGRVLAQEVIAREALPPFDNSAMDGFCVRAGATDGASAERPAMLRLGPTLFAGKPLAESEMRDADALRIMTGAPLPPGFDTVIRVEDAVVERDGGGELLRLDAPVPPGSHVRKQGEDVAIGDRLIEAGRVLSGGLLSVLAGQGIGEVAVVARPRLRLLATGDELVEDPNRPLEPGQIRNTSLPFLIAEGERLGLPVIREGVVPDREDDVLDRVRGWLDERAGMTIDDPDDPAVPDVIISTGAVSVGHLDFVPSMLARLGFEILIHGVAVRPGRPVLVARHRDGALLWVGLPGNVLSTVAGFRFFVLPVLRSLMGVRPGGARLRARLAHPFSKPAGLRFFARCVLRPGSEGVVEAYLDRRQGSGMVSALAGTDAYAIIPEGPEFLPAGAVVEVESDFAGLG